MGIATSFSSKQFKELWSCNMTDVSRTKIFLEFSFSPFNKINNLKLKNAQSLIMLTFISSNI